MEPSISLQGDRYGGFSVGYEQDAWFPTITVGDFYGVSSPTVGAAYYGNNTSVTVNSGSSAAGSGSPVPYWRTMQYQWGYGLGGADSNYADVSGTPTGTSWSHTTTGVTAHRRFHFFAVSKSGRTSGQASGSTGGWTWDSGHAKYYDVWVDNVAPVNPSFSSAAAASTTSMTVNWAIPLDQGVGVGAGSIEAAGNLSNNQDANNYYRRGDVGVQVYRNASTTISAWSGASTTVTDTGLSPNTQYTYTLEARDNTGESRGTWHNATGQQGSTAKYTLSVAPTSSTVTSEQSNPAGINWTAVGGFGAGTVHHYSYVFDQSATHTFTGSEATWSSGTLMTVPTAGGTWYLHVRGFNGDSVANGTYDYAVTAPTAPTVTTQPQPQTACAGATATFTVAASGTSPGYAWYKHANAGWGGAWTVGASGGGTFLASAANNNNGEANCNTFSSTADINTPGGNSLGLYGGSGGESVSRVFPAALTNGQVFRIDMDNGNVDSGKQNGFALHDSGGTLLLSFYFLGGQSNYKCYDSTGEHDTGIGFYRHGLRVQVTVGTGSPNTYALLVTPCNGGTSGFSGTLAASGGPAKVVLFNNNASGGAINDLYFNTIMAGTAFDNADNYSSAWAGQDKGDQQITGADSASYGTASGSNGDQYYAIPYNSAGVAVSSSASLTIEQSPLKWIGGNGNWDFASAGLWQDSAAVASTYCDSYQVLLDDSASVSTPAVTLNASVAPASVTNNSTKDYTISGTGKITGIGGLTKLGSSTLTLNTSNDYSGTTTVSAGTLAGTGTILGPVTINSGGTLAPGAGATLGTLTVSNNLTLSGTANLRINKSGSTLTSDQVAGISTRANSGTLHVTLVSGSAPLADGDTFPLFSAAASTGVFAATNLPSVGAGTNWWTTNDYGTLTFNVWPTAGGVSYTRPQGLSLKLKIADVLTNVTGAVVGKTIRLGGVGASTNSATITTNSTYILYNPASGNNNDENFSYTASDGRGGSPSANIHVSVVKWTGSTQTITVTNNQVTLNFAGIPSYSYAVLRSTNLTDWTTLVTTNAPAAGLFQWTDDFSDLGGPPASAYYRLQQP
jgi:autotransporter-associated beta strand protein